ncbi:MAG: hypothetical protein E7397_00820 [Ruminococcaceae bacterium]|nr:hypothetical protein [Oscillospiraceae bacterium]
MKKKKIILVVAIVILVLVGIVLALSFSQKEEQPAETPVVEQTKAPEEAIGTPEATKEAEPAPEQPAEETKAPEKTAEPQKPAEKTEEPVKVKPTFMYFVSEADADYKKAVEVFENLKKEYGDRVNFDLKNVTKDPTILENFALVDGQTPALIMLNSSNDINNFCFKNCDEAQLKKEIENAF